MVLFTHALNATSTFIYAFENLNSNHIFIYALPNNFHVWRSFYQGCARDDNCVIRDLQKLTDDTRYNDFDISEDTLKETFTNLILAGSSNVLSKVKSITPYLD